MLAAIGPFEAQLSSTAFQLLGMADIGSLPQFFGLGLNGSTPLGLECCFELLFH